MSTGFIGIPARLLEKAEKVSTQEHITVEELVQDAVERRINAKGLSHIFAIGDRNAKRTGAKFEDVETEIAARRSERPH